jgi:hypothetical protein
MERTKKQEEALQAYLRASHRYDATWQTATNVQIETLRTELNDCYRLMVWLTDVRWITGKSEGINAAMHRTYPELRGPDISGGQS